MTECDNAEIRDVLPDHVAESLGAAELSRVTMHLAECGSCREEVSLLRLARAARPQAVHLDIDAIVARLGKPGQNASSTSDRVETCKTAAGIERAISVRTSPVVASIAAHRAPRRWSRVWQMAAAIGVLVIGGWSAYLVQGRGFGVMTAGRSDSARFSEVAERALGGGNGVTSRVDSGATSVMLADAGLSADSAWPVGGADRGAPERSRRNGVVSVGDLSDYTDAELQRMLDRLDKWDGATSSEVIPAMPIVSVSSTGSD